MAYNYEYPYTDPNRFNVDWLLNEIKKLRVEMSEFVNLNTIRFHDPIQWDITTQYEKLEVVTNGGYAYLSKQPVPVGVGISNTDYWQNIGQFNIDGDTIRKAIAEANEEFNLVASKNYVKGELLWFKGDLYECILPITIGSGLVVDTNISLVTIEELIKRVNDRVDDIIDLFNTTLTVNDFIVNGDTNLNGDVTVVGDTKVEKLKINDIISYGEVESVSPYFDSVPMKDKNGNDYNILIETELSKTLVPSDWVYPEDYGAVGDGVADDTVAIQNCFNDAVSLNKGVKALKTYKITDTVYVPSNLYIDGFNTGKFIDKKSIIGADFETRTTFFMDNVSNITVTRCTFEGENPVTSYVAKYYWLAYESKNIYFSYCTFDKHNGVGMVYAHGSNSIYVMHSTFDNYTRGAILFTEGTSDSGVFYCTITNGNEVTSGNRYPIMLCGYYYPYTQQNLAPSAYNLYAIGNKIQDTTPLWEGIDCHGGNDIYIAYNTINNVSCPIAVFTDLSLGFMARDVHIHDNTCTVTSSLTGTVGANYGMALGGSRFFVHDNYLAYGGYGKPSANSAALYINYADYFYLHNNVFYRCYGTGILLSSLMLNNLHITNNMIAAVTGSTNNSAIKIMSGSDVYMIDISENDFQGVGYITEVPLGKSTTAEMIRLSNNIYRGVTPTHSNMVNIKPDIATPSQMANCTTGYNGDVVRNATPSVGSPKGWIMTGSVNGTGTYVSLGNL